MVEIFRDLIRCSVNEVKCPSRLQGIKFFLLLVSHILESLNGGGSGRCGSLMTEDAFGQVLRGVRQLIGIIHQSGLLALITDPPAIATFGCVPR